MICAIGWRRCPSAGLNFGGIFDLESLQSRIAEIERTMAQGDFWSDQEGANKTIQVLKGLKSQRDPIVQFEQGLRDLTELLELTDSGDAASIGHLTKDLAGLEKLFTQLEIKRLLGADVDSKHAIVAIHSGSHLCCARSLSADPSTAAGP